MSSIFNEKNENKNKNRLFVLKESSHNETIFEQNLFDGGKWQVVTMWSEIIGLHVISRVRRRKQRWQAVNTDTQFIKQIIVGTFNQLFNIKTQISNTPFTTFPKYRINSRTIVFRQKPRESRKSIYNMRLMHEIKY